MVQVFERILLPLDGSDDWERLVPHLETLAVSPMSEVVVLEAVPFVETLLEMPKAFSAIDLGMSGDLDVAEKYVSAVVEMLESRGIHARGITQVGSDIPTIASVARRQKVSLVALAIRDLGGFPWRRLKTYAEHVLMACPVPIYAVPAHGDSDVPAQRTPGAVLIPVDGTGLSLQVIPAAAEFCHRMGATMLFVHILDKNASELDITGVFRKALSQAEREGISAESFLGRGDPSEEILKCCFNRNISMIAMRGRLAPNEKSGSLGKVMVKVLRAARVPMLVVRRPHRPPRGLSDRPEVPIDQITRMT